MKRISSIAILCSFLMAGCDGPLGPFAGGELSGTLHQGTLDDWSFVTDVEVIALETQPADPHSVSVWPGVVDGRLYIPTSLISGKENPAERDWVRHVLADPNVRLRVGDIIYAATATRVTDADTVNKVTEVMLAKYAEDATSQSDGAWIFRLDPR